MLLMATQKLDAMEQAKAIVIRVIIDHYPKIVAANIAHLSGTFLIANPAHEDHFFRYRRRT